MCSVGPMSSSWAAELPVLSLLFLQRVEERKSFSLKAKEPSAAAAR